MLKAYNSWSEAEPLPYARITGFRFQGSSFQYQEGSLSAMRPQRILFFYYRIESDYKQ